jgi:hypothetical protein
MSILLTIALGVALTAAQTGYLSAFPAPVPLLHLPLIAIANEVSAFRFGRAYALAATSGLLLDLLVTPRLAVETPILLAVTLVLGTLFTRVFTNSSLPSMLALNTAGFFLLHAAFCVRDAFAATIGGDPVALLLGWDRIVPLLPGLLLQLATVLAAVGIIAGVRRAVGSVIVLR